MLPGSRLESVLKVLKLDLHGRISRNPVGKSSFEMELDEFDRDR